jgi:hypothetical protein
LNSLAFFLNSKRKFPNSKWGQLERWNAQIFNGGCRALANCLSSHSPRDGGNTPSFHPLLHPCCTLPLLENSPAIHFSVCLSFHEPKRCAACPVHYACGLWLSFPSHTREPKIYHVSLLITHNLIPNFQNIMMFQKLSSLAQVITIIVIS